MRKILLIFFAFVTTLTSLAQTSDSDRKEEHKKRVNALEKEEGVIAYKKQFAFGMKLISDGYGAFFELGRAHSVKKSLLFQLEIDERKSAKEQKQPSPFDAYDFIYGKENFFYPIKLGVQQQTLLGNKSNKNGVCVTANYGGGLAIALLRPYEMQSIYDSVNDTKYVKYSSQDSTLFLTQGSPAGYDLSGNYYPAIFGFVGGPGFGQGWNDLSIVPGVYVKGALRFDYGRYNEVVSALEVGITAEYYTQKIPIMVFANPEQFFVSAYASIIFGKRK
jgi:hypothetical protein